MRSAHTMEHDLARRGKEALTPTAVQVDVRNVRGLEDAGHAGPHGYSMSLSCIMYFIFFNLFIHGRHTEVETEAGSMQEA